MKNGFTLIEIMVVIAIGIILLALVLFPLYNLLSSQSLNRDFVSTASLVERARSMAINQKNDSSFGVHFSSSSVSLFSGSSYSTSTQIEKFNLSGRTYFSSISLGTSTDIVFERITGYASATGTVSLSLKTSSSTKTLSVFKTGIIQY